MNATEQRSNEILVKLWEKWTSNGLVDMPQTKSTLRYAVDASYRDKISDTKWLGEALAQLCIWRADAILGEALPAYLEAARSELASPSPRATNTTRRTFTI